MLMFTLATAGAERESLSLALFHGNINTIGSIVKNATVSAAKAGRSARFINQNLMFGGEKLAASGIEMSTGTDPTG